MQIHYKTYGFVGAVAGFKWICIKGVYVVIAKMYYKRTEILSRYVHVYTIVYSLDVFRTAFFK